MKKSLTTLIFIVLLTSYGSCELSKSGDNKQVVAEIPLAESPERDTVKYPVPLYPVDTSVAYLTGHFTQEVDSNFIEIDPQYADRAGLWLRKDAYAAFLKMYAAAQKEGINLTIRSATRNFEYQKGIWERKWTGKTAVNGEHLNRSTPDPEQRATKILSYSSMPGTSRHHWGTDIDLNSFNNSYFSTGEGLRIYNWLSENAVDYGFQQPYTAFGSDRSFGYNEEKWHWSFYPISNVLTQAAARSLDDTEIKGFLGSETASKLKVVEKYILGINPLLLDGLLPENKVN